MKKHLSYFSCLFLLFFSCKNEVRSALGYLYNGSTESLIIPIFEKKELMVN